MINLLTITSYNFNRVFDLVNFLAICLIFISIVIYFFTLTTGLMII